MKNLVLVFLCMGAASALASDSCEEQLPASLQSLIPGAFPGFRTPSANDNPTEGGDCLGVASADLDGSGNQDFVLGLSAVEGSDGIVAVAFAEGEGWKLQALSEPSGPRSHLYVTTGEPGTYQRSGVLDGPLEPGEVELLECPHSVAIFGAVESSGVAYCYSNGQWQHAWISD